MMVGIRIYGCVAAEKSRMAKRLDTCVSVIYLAYETGKRTAGWVMVELTNN